MLVRLTPSGSMPMAEPISALATARETAAKLPPPRQVTAASRRSRRAGRPEPRRAARDPASRTASMTSAEETLVPLSRWYRAMRAR